MLICFYSFKLSFSLYFHSEEPQKVCNPFIPLTAEQKSFTAQIDKDSAFKCDVCGKLYASSNDVQLHQRLRHKQNNAYGSLPKDRRKNQNHYESGFPTNVPSQSLDDVYQTIQDVEQTFVHATEATIRDQSVQEYSSSQQLLSSTHSTIRQSRSIAVKRKQARACDVCHKLYASQQDVDIHKSLRHQMTSDKQIANCLKERKQLYNDANPRVVTSTLLTVTLVRVKVFTLEIFIL